MFFNLTLHPRTVALICFCFCGLNLAAQEAANVAFKDPTGVMRYVADTENNYIADFSHAGYKNGEAELPEVPVVRTISAIQGEDNTAHIQAALDEVAALTPDENGYRGALLLERGSYLVSGRLFIRESGMVLRGESQSAEIIATGNTPALRDVIVVGNTSNLNWRGETPGTISDVTSPFVPAGSRALEVADAGLYSVGDNVIITQPSTTTWLASIGFGETASDAPWAPGDLDIYYNRYVTDVNLPENKITLDAPIHDHLERALAQSRVYVLNQPNQQREIGIENLSIQIMTNGELDEEHARTAIYMANVEDCWIKDVTALHFVFAMVDTRAASRITIADCSALRPHSQITGARRYNFNVSAYSNNILFKGCHATEGRHSFVSNGTSSASGIVWTDCFSEFDYNASEGHRRWSQGLLFDKINFQSANGQTLLALYNRGNLGTGHGWSSVNSVAWNIRTQGSRKMSIQKPPSRQNFAVGCFSNISGDGPFAQPTGYIEQTNQLLEIPSLYDEQLAQRTLNGALPDAPARLTQILTTEGDVVLDWLEIASRETGYIVEVSRDEGLTFIEVATLPANSTTYTDPDPFTTEDFLVYRVYSVRDGLPSPYSNPSTVMRDVSIREASKAELQIVPNPVADRLTIRANEPVLEVFVHNAAGALIAHSERSTSLITSDWPVGLYYLKVKLQSGALRSSRIVKN